VCVFFCLFVRSFVRLCLCLCFYLCMFVCMYVCMCIYICVCVCAFCVRGGGRSKSCTHSFDSQCPCLVSGLRRRWGWETHRGTISSVCIETSIAVSAAPTPHTLAVASHPTSPAAVVAQFARGSIIAIKSLIVRVGYRLARCKGRKQAHERQRRRKEKKM
jgi:hypothetical protein